MNNWKIFEDHLQMQEMIYTRRIGAYGSENAVRMEQFKEWIAGQGYMSPDAVILGIARDNAETTLPENCRYDICLIGSYEIDVDWIQKEPWKAAGMLSYSFHIPQRRCESSGRMDFLI